MNISELSTKHWPSVAVAVALVALFGLSSMIALPIQLLPTIEEPQVSVANFWRAAAPEEMEANIMTPLNTYMEESIAKFITGAMPLSDYDKFLREIDRYGDWRKIISVKNAALAVAKQKMGM